MNELWFALVFFLPAGLANGAPPIANKIPILKNWNAPMDFGKKIRGRRLFGEHKTWRGLLFGTFVAALTGLVINLFYPEFAHKLWVVPMTPAANMACLGALLGFGALIGDAVESAIKRQLNIKPGGSWFPFDQLDYIVGGLVFASLSVDLTPSQCLWVIGVWFVIHLIGSYTGYLLKLKDRPI
jgi:CDP-2,3-bis-(O-geranylgeranyl)-sn-glycerol synthase